MNRKLLIAILILFFGISSSNAQFKMGNTLTPLTGNLYPIILSNDAQGGLHQVATIAARNAIPALRRQQGMLCAVLDAGSGTPKTYQLIGGILDANWVEFTLGSATTVTTNANLTGPITSVGNTTSVASQTGTGSTFVMSASPILTTPNLGTPTALVGTNITGTAAGLTAGNVTGIVAGANGGTGVANTGKTITLGGNLTTGGAYPTTLTSTAATTVTLPTTGTLATLAGTEALTGKTINGLTPTASTTGFTIAGGTTSKTLTVSSDATVSGTNTGDQTLPTLVSLNAVAANTAITAGTNTKITYDAKGLVTAGAAATTADIAASTNKNYVTDAQQTVLANTSGVNTGDQTNVTGTAANVTGIVAGANGGTGVANTGKTITLGGNLTTGGAYQTTLTSTAATTVTLPTTGTLATLAGAEALTGKTINGLTPTAATTGFTIAGGTTSKTLTVSSDATVSGTNTGDQTNITGNAATASTASTVTTNANMTGDVTSVGNATTIANNAVNYGKMQTVTASRLLGNPLASTATPSEISIGSGLSLSTGGVLTAAGSGGTVTSASVVTANGVSGTVANATTAPAITLSLGAITPTSVVASGNLSGTQLTSTVAIGTAPLVVTSTTPVANLSIGGNASTVTTNANLTGMVTSIGNSTTVITNANLTGEVTSTGNTTTVGNAAVIGKVLTGYTSGAGTITASDNILTAIQKLNGNDVTNANSVWNLTGNAGTTAGTNFIGTTDNKDVVFKRSGIQSGLLGFNNTSFGLLALNAATTGINNVAIGISALAANTSGGNNTATGISALANNTTGTSNTATGGSALMLNTTGGSNTATGVSALNSNTTGGNNTAIGSSALVANTTGVNNVAIGFDAGYGDESTAAQQSVIDNNALFLGYMASRDIVANTTALTNITAIGSNAKVSQSNSLILGGTGANAVSVGIGNTAPAASAVLDITSTTKGSLMPRMTTAQKTAIASPAKGLIVYDTDLNQLQVYNGTGWGTPAANLTGDVTSVGNVTSIASNAVSNSDLNTVATGIIKGRVSAATGNVEDLTATQVRTLLNVADGANNYVHPTGDGNLHVPATSTTNSGKVLTAGATAGSLSWVTPTTGSVTSASVVTANGVSGSVATPTTTPAITLTLGAITPTSVAATGALSGTQLTSTIVTGTAPLVVTSTTPVANLSIGGNAATATSATNFSGNLVGDVTGTQGATVVGKINGTLLSGLSTGILKNTTTTGVPTIAVAGTDYQSPLVSGTSIKTVNSISLLGSGDITITPNATHTGDVTGATALTIAPNAVTYAKMQNVSASRLIGNPTAGATVPSEITVGSGLNLSTGGVLTSSGSGGTVTTASVVTANGVSGSVATASTTPAITLTLGAITPTSVAASGNLSGAQLTSTVATGTAPLVVTSTTPVANLSIGGNAATATTASTVTTNANMTGDVTSVGNATMIANNAVTLSKLQQIATNSLVGRSTASTGNAEVITVGSGLTLSGGTLTASGSGGTVTSASVVTANGVSGSVATASTTPAITLTLGAITPTSVAASGNLSGAQLTSTVATGTAPLVVTSTTPVANLSIGGNASTATTATSATTATNTGITEDLATVSAVYPTWVTANSGNLPQKVSSTKLSFVPSTGVLTSGGIVKSGGTSGQFLKADGSVDSNSYLTGNQFISFSTTAGDVTGSAAGTTIIAPTLSIGNNKVTYAKMQTVTASRLLGNPTASAAVPSEITVGSGLNLSTGGVLTASGSGGTVTSASVVTANGVSGTVANATTAPDITLTLGAITPTSVAATSTLSGTQLTSTVAIGTAPLVVTSTTPVANLSIGGNAATVTTNANLNGMVTSIGNSTTVITNANLTGEVTSTGNATTVSNAAVIGKVLTGYTSGAGTITASDNILTAIQKLNGNVTASTNSAWNLTGNAGTVAGTNFIGTSDDINVVFKRNGIQAGLLSNAANNTSWGVGALNVASPGSGNTAIGNNAMSANNSGGNNVALGNLSMSANTTGINNTGVGRYSLASNIGGSQNTALGYSAGYTDGNTTTPMGLSNSTAIGAYAQVTASSSLILGGTGSYAVSVGIGNTAPAASAVLDITSTTKGSLMPRMTTAQKTAIASPATGLIVYDTTLNQLQVYNGTVWGATTASTGWNLTGNAGTTAGPNFIGTTDNKDVVFKRNGIQSGLLGLNNTSFGLSALNPAATGTGNVAIGISSLAANTSGVNSIAIGSQALANNTSGFNNTATGAYALLFNTTGGSNTATGVSALNSNTTGGNNTAIGSSALVANTTGVNNVAIGFNAGYGDDSSTANQSVIDNNALFLGYQASRDIVANTTALTNITAIGSNAKVSQSNSLILGGTGANAVSVGIGTTAPASTLDVVGDVSAKRYLTTMPAAITAAATTTVDLSTGNVFTLNVAASITTLTLTNAPTRPATFVFKLSYSSSTAYTIAWPAAFLWSGGIPPVLTCVSGKTDILSIIFDGTNYYCSYALNF